MRFVKQDHNENVLFALQLAIAKPGSETFAAST
jgi:hypothetical protein